VEESHTIGKKKLIKEVTDFQTFNAWESFFINQEKRDLVNIAEPSTPDCLLGLGNKQFANSLFVCKQFAYSLQTVCKQYVNFQNKNNR